ncbi:MAG: Holliday junction resolvase RuvX [Candidatus Lernaella stagnicola]|nr:Holliday junction resolvase RuvX [Candidatus Lernaella stagnicola]
MRALAIDVGTVRVGLAVSDPLGLTAQPLVVIRRGKPAADLEAIRAVVTEKEVDILVVGLPINMDGSEGPAATMARDFAKLLEPLGLPIEFADERLSSAVAEHVLLAADMRRDKRKQVRDKVAAAVILQAWLDGRGRGNLA